MKLVCHVCKHEGEPILKMGGLLCEKCRVILKEPYVDAEYFEYLTKEREKWKKKHSENSTDQ